MAAEQLPSRYGARTIFLRSLTGGQSEGSVSPSTRSITDNVDGDIDTNTNYVTPEICIPKGGDDAVNENNRVRVSLSVVFLKIGEIDTLKEQYEADVMIKSKWREPALDKAKLEFQEVKQPIDWGDYWNPKIFIENTIGEPKENVFQMLTYNDRGEALVTEKRRVKGTFLENLELSDFPFDVQDLTVTVMSDRPQREIDIIEDPHELHRVNRQSFIDEQEWLLYKYVETEFREVSNEYADPNVKRYALFVKCRAARRPAYFFWNIFLITFLITSLAFVTFAVDRTRPQNRLQLSFTLVLTSVAFKFVVNQSLPKISYLTYLDKYVLAALLLLVAVSVWHGLTSVFNHSVADTVDRAVLVAFFVLYALFNIVFALRISMKPGQKRKIMKKKDVEYNGMVHPGEEQIVKGNDSSCTSAPIAAV